MLQLVEVGSAYFHSVINSLEDSKRAFLDDKFTSDKFYLVFEGRPVGGFTTNTDGSLAGLFSLKKGRGDEIQRLRIYQAIADADRGVEKLTLFCTGDFLRDYYLSRGFKIDKFIDWDDQYAPEKWDYETYGRPNLYTMYKEI